MVAASDTLVFLPAWNEEDNLPAVLDEVHRELPAADVLVVDDGSTDGTADVAREHGAEVVSFGGQPRPPGRHCSGIRLCGGARIRVLRARGRRRPASRGGARAAAGARAGRRLRRRGRLALRQRRRLCPLPVQAFRATPARHGASTALDGSRPRQAFLRRDQRHVCGEREGDGSARASVHDRSARGRSAPAPRRSRFASGRGSSGHAAARGRRVEAQGQEGAPGGRDDRRHAPRHPPLVEARADHASRRRPWLLEPADARPARAVRGSGSGTPSSSSPAKTPCCSPAGRAAAATAPRPS